jgi:hypothetical protein
MSNEPQEPVFWEATSGGPAAQEPSIVELGVPPARQPDADRVLGALRRPLFPIFGLPADRPGRRYIRGWQEAGPVVTCIELGLFDESNDTLVVVSTSPRRPWDSMSTDDEALFRRIMEMASAPQDLEPHGYIRSSLVLEMSGHLVTFACVCHGRITVLWSRHGPGILVQARNLPPQDIELVMLPDAGPYVEGLAR